MLSFPSLLPASRILGTSSSQRSFTARKDAFCCSTTRSNSAISCIYVYIETHNVLKFCTAMVLLDFVINLVKWISIAWADQRVHMCTKYKNIYTHMHVLSCLTWVSWQRKGYVSTKDPMENWSESSNVLRRKENVLAIKSSMALGSELVWKYTMGKYCNMSLKIHDHYIFWKCNKLIIHATGSRNKNGGAVKRVSFTYTCIHVWRGHSLQWCCTYLQPLCQRTSLDRDCNILMFLRLESSSSPTPCATGRTVGFTGLGAQGVLVRGGEKSSPQARLLARGVILGFRRYLSRSSKQRTKYPWGYSRREVFSDHAD